MESIATAYKMQFFFSLWFITAHKMDFTVAYDIVSKLLQVLNICKFILECLHFTVQAKLLSDGCWFVLVMKLNDIKLFFLIILLFRGH